MTPGVGGTPTPPGKWEPLGIVGSGPLATTLGILLRRAGAPVKVLAGRDEARTRAAADRVGCEAVLGATEAARRAPWLLLVVSDRAIPEVAQEIASAWSDALPDRAAACHISGALGADALRPIQGTGGGTGVAHPLQSVVTVEAGLDWLPRATFGISGEGVGLEMARAVADAVGGHVIEVSDDGRPLYHAAAVVASNYLAVLLHMAAGLMAHGTGHSEEECLSLLMPLVHGTVENMARHGPVQGLTGPVARGDAQVVQRHRDAMRERQVPESWHGIYRMLGLDALEMARTRGLDAAAAQRVAQALAAPPHEEGSSEPPVPPVP